MRRDLEERAVVEPIAHIERLARHHLVIVEGDGVDVPRQAAEEDARVVPFALLLQPISRASEPLAGYGRIDGSLFAFPRL